MTESQPVGRSSPRTWRLDSAERLQALDDLGLVPGLIDETFDTYTRLVARLLHAPVALVTLVNDECQYFPSSIGLDEPWASRAHTPLSMSFCKHVVVTDDVLSVTDARTDPRVSSNESVEKLSVRAYLGVPLRAPGGEPLGSLCAIDTQPRQWSDDDLAILRDVAEAVAASIALRASEQRQLRYAIDASHELRTPLTSLRLTLEDLTEWDGIDADARDALRRAVADVDHLSALAERLLTRADAEARGQARDVDVVAIAHEVAALADRDVIVEADRPVVLSSVRSVLRLVVSAMVDDVIAAGHDRVVVRVGEDGRAGRVGVAGVDQASSASAGDVARANDRSLAAAERVAMRIGGHLRVIDGPPRRAELVLPPSRRQRDSQD